MRDPASYEWQGFVIPERMAGGLLRWVLHGIPPGDFLQAVLRNDLRGACERGDDENLRNIPAFIAWLYNEAPSACWGSPERVDTWRGEQPVNSQAAYPTRAEEPIETRDWPMPPRS